MVERRLVVAGLQPETAPVLQMTLRDQPLNGHRHRPELVDDPVHRVWRVPWYDAYGLHPASITDVRTVVPLVLSMSLARRQSGLAECRTQKLHVDARREILTVPTGNAHAAQLQASTSGASCHRTAYFRLG